MWMKSEGELRFTEYPAPKTTSSAVFRQAIVIISSTGPGKSRTLTSRVRRISVRCFLALIRSMATPACWAGGASYSSCTTGMLIEFRQGHQGRGQALGRGDDTPRHHAAPTSRRVLGMIPDSGGVTAVG